MVIYKHKSESFQPSRASQVSQFDFDCGINFVFKINPRLQRLVTNMILLSWKYYPISHMYKLHLGPSIKHYDWK